MKRWLLLAPLLVFTTLQESTCGEPAEACDGIDNNGDGTIDEGLDADGDGFSDCATAPVPGDCDDNNPTINPGATEVACDGLDQDCSGDDALLLWYADHDGDGYGLTLEALSTCSAPAGYVLLPDDCLDSGSGLPSGGRGSGR